mgnify:CR=1
MLDNDASGIAKLLQTCSVSFIKKGANMIIQLISIVYNTICFIASVLTIISYLKER